MTLRTPTVIRPWSLPELGHVLRACAGVRGKHRQLGQAVLQMALLELACTDDPPRAAGLVERVATGSKKAAAEITALLDAHHQLVQAPPAAPPPPPLDANSWAQAYPAPAPTLARSTLATGSRQPDPARGGQPGWGKPATPKPEPKTAKPQPDAHLPARQNLAPCPRGTERHRIVHWIAQGLIDPAALGYPTSGLAGAVAAAYRRLFGDRLPARDPTCRSFCIYSRREIALIAANISPRK